MGRTDSPFVTWLILWSRVLSVSRGRIRVFSLATVFFPDPILFVVIKNLIYNYYIVINIDIIISIQCTL